MPSTHMHGGLGVATADEHERILNPKVGVIPDAGDQKDIPGAVMGVEVGSGHRSCGLTNQATKWVGESGEWGIHRWVRASGVISNESFEYCAVEEESLDVIWLFDLPEADAAGVGPHEDARPDHAGVDVNQCRSATSTPVCLA